MTAHSISQRMKGLRLQRAVVLVGACVSMGATDLGRPHPEYGAWGFDIAGRDTNVAPGDDFFEYSNGGYLKQLVIPTDKASYGPRYIAAERTQARIHEILQEAAAKVGDATPSTIEGKIGAYYAAFLNDSRAESLGGRPLEANLSAIRAASSRTALAELMGRQNEDFYASPFRLAIHSDMKRPQCNAIYISQDGLGLPDRSYYLDSKFSGIKSAYQAYAARMLTLVRWPDADARALEITNLETKLADASWDRKDQRDLDKTYNPMSIRTLARAAPGFGWNSFFEGARLGKERRIVAVEASALPKLASVMADTPISTIKAWLAFRAADNAAPFLSSAFVEANFDLRGRALLGVKDLSPRWQRGVHAVSGGDFVAGDRNDRFGTMGWAVGEIYAARYFPPRTKSAIQQLVSGLKRAFKARIVQLDWMSAQTKSKALKKLDAYKIEVGYPQKARDYSQVVIRRDDLLGDVRRLAFADWRHELSKVGRAPDRDEWLMTPQTNDAYNGPLNVLVFPAAILQPPNFDADADPAVNYGSAGSAIGHEFTHGFDDQGRKFDDQGRLKDWWTPSDARRFQERAARLGAQFSSYEPLPGLHVNGAVTMGENIADLGGVAIALDAYHTSLHGRPAPVLDGLSGDQRFFLGWAQAWRSKVRDDAMRRQVVSDPHAPRQFRVNGIVRNVDAWYSAFGVKPDQKLYLAPLDRARIW